MPPPSSLQLDIYGELADVMAQARKGGLPPPPQREAIREAFLQHLEKIWSKPDEGIWEIRGAPQHFVHSKVMTWVAFDRAAQNAGMRTARAGALPQASPTRSTRTSAPRAWTRSAAVSSRPMARSRMDASLLLLPLVGFLPATDKRIKATVREIEKRLLYKGLVQRYETETGVDGLPPGEGAFLACSFWLADNYLLQGRRSRGEAAVQPAEKACQ